MGPYLFVNAFLAGFFAFGAVYHFILWLRTRRESTLLAFVVVSLIQSGQAVAVLLVAIAETTADGQFALNLRTAGGALNVAALAWLLAIVSGFQPRWYLWTCTTILLAGVVYSETVTPMTGLVIGVERTVTAWGESITRSAHQNTWKSSTTTPDEARWPSPDRDDTRTRRCAGSAAILRR